MTKTAKLIQESKAKGLEVRVTGKTTAITSPRGRQQVFRTTGNGWWWVMSNNNIYNYRTKQVRNMLDLF